MTRSPGTSSTQGMAFATPSRSTRDRGAKRPANLRRRLGPPVQIGVHACDRHEREAENARFGIVAKPSEEQRGRDQEPDHRVLRRVTEDSAPTAACVPEGIVAAIAMPPLLDLLGRQAALGVAKPSDAV